MARAETERRRRPVPAGEAKGRRPAATPPAKGRRQDGARRPPAPPAARKAPAAGKQGAAKPARPARQPAPRRPGRLAAVAANGRLAALLLAVALAAGLAYGLTADAFNVRRLDVAGAALTTEQQVAAAGRVTGNNVFSVDPQAVAERLAALPTVREARVRAALPDRLVVQLTERQPALVWQVGNDRYLVDESGFVIADTVGDDQARSLVTVRVLAGDSPRVGGKVDAAAIRATEGVVQRLARSNPFSLNGLEYAPNTGVVLVGSGGWRVILGDDSRLDDKLAVAAAVVKQLQQDNTTWQTLDVTDPDRPFFK